MLYTKDQTKQLKLNTRLQMKSQEKEALSNLMEIDFNNDAKDSYNPFNALYNGSSDNLKDYDSKNEEITILKNSDIEKKLYPKVIQIPAKIIKEINPSSKLEKDVKYNKPDVKIRKELNPVIKPEKHVKPDVNNQNIIKTISKNESTIKPKNEINIQPKNKNNIKPREENYKRPETSTEHSITNVKQRLERLKSKDENLIHLPKWNVQKYALSEFLAKYAEGQIKLPVYEVSKLKNAIIENSVSKNSQSYEISNWNVNNLNDMEKKINKVTNYGKLKLSFLNSKIPKIFNEAHHENKNADSIVGFVPNNDGKNLRKGDSLPQSKFPNRCRSNFSIPSLSNIYEQRPPSHITNKGINTDRYNYNEKDAWNNFPVTDIKKSTSRNFSENSKQKYDSVVDVLASNDRFKNINENSRCLKKSLSDTRCFDQDKIISNLIGETNFNSIQIDSSTAKKNLNDKITKFSYLQSNEITKNNVKEGLKIISSLNNSKKIKERIKKSTNTETNIFIPYNKSVTKPIRIDQEASKCYQEKSRCSLKSHMAPDFSLQKEIVERKKNQILSKNYPGISNVIIGLNDSNRDYNKKIGTIKKNNLNESILPAKEKPYVPHSYMPSIKTKRKHLMGHGIQKSHKGQVVFSNAIVGPNVKPKNQNKCFIKLNENSADINIYQKSKFIENDGYENSQDNTQYNKFGKYKNDLETGNFTVKYSEENSPVKNERSHLSNSNKGFSRV